MYIYIYVSTKYDINRKTRSYSIFTVSNKYGHSDILRDELVQQHGQNNQG